MVSPSGAQVCVSDPANNGGVRPLPVLLTLALLGSAALGFKITPIPATPQPGAPGTLPELQPVGAPLPELKPVSPAPAAAPLPPASTLPGQPIDPLFAQQWDLTAISMPQTWALLARQKLTPAPVTVAVVDTGLIPSPELAGRLVNGYDFVSNPARAGDGDGRDPDARGLGPNAYHAEVVGNIIAAAHDGRGMAGINPQAKIVEVRVAGIDGLVDPVDLTDALRWAAGLSVPGAPANPNPARIVNLSLYADFIPLTGCDSRIQKAVDEVTARGVLVVVGAGNDDQDVRGYSPAGCRNVLTVTSVSAGGVRPAYANWGQNVAVAAHGGDATQRLTLSSSLQPGGVMTPEAGTSLAAPHVTGVASLLLGVRPKLTPLQLKDLITRSATPFPGGRCDPDPRKLCGSGTLNAETALKRALASGVGK